MEEMKKENGAGDLPRVTHILQEVGIIDTMWYNKEGADRGTDIHLLTEMIDEGLMSYTDIIGNNYEGWLTAYYQFKTDNRIEIKEIEHTVKYGGNYPYQGHLDRVMLINGEMYIVDIKTGQVVNWNGIQLAAYGMAYNPRIKRAVLKLRKDGTYKFKTKIKVDLSSDYWLRKWTGILKDYYQMEGKNGK